jgi:RalA-binding protein 1
LIVEAKKGPGGNHPRHVLCAESDEDRDSWVEILVRYFSGTYSEEPVQYGPSPVTVNPVTQQNGVISTAQPRASSSSSDSPSSSRRPIRGLSKDDISISKGAAVPISQLAPDPHNAKLFQLAPQPEDYTRSSSPSKSMEPSPTDVQGSGAAFEVHSRSARRILEQGWGQPSSLPDSSPLSGASQSSSELSSGPLGQRANSELGHYPDLQDHLSKRQNRQVSPERHRIHTERKLFHPSLGAVQSSSIASSPTDRIPSPDKLDTNGKVKISGPMNGTPIPSGFKFGKDVPSVSEAAAAERRAKSRSFWGFGKANGTYTQTQVPIRVDLPRILGDKSSQPAYVPRAVFGVPLDEALDVVQIANLPAIVFRCIQYLEAKEADQEEGIYRLSGSSAVIKSLKDRFNTGAYINSYSLFAVGLLNKQRVMWIFLPQTSTGTRMPSQAFSRASCVNSQQAFSLVTYISGFSLSSVGVSHFVRLWF